MSDKDHKHYSALIHAVATGGEKATQALNEARSTYKQKARKKHQKKNDERWKYAYLLGVYQEQLGKNRAAYRAIRYAVTVQPIVRHYRLYLLLLIRMGKQDALQAMERQVIRDVLDSKDVASNLIYHAIEGGFEAIAKQWHEWCQDRPYNTEAILTSTVASLLTKENHYELSERVLDWVEDWVQYDRLVIIRMMNANGVSNRQAALDVARKALDILPKPSPLFLCLAAQAFGENGLNDESEALHLRNLKEYPEDANAILPYSSFMANSRRYGEASETLRRFLENPPVTLGDTDGVMRSNLVFYTIHRDDITYAQMFEDTKHIASRGIYSRVPDNTHRLNPKPGRIGFFSADMYSHPVANFVMDIFAALKQHGCEVVVFSNTPKQDHVTERLKAHASDWINIVGMRYEQVAERAVRERLAVAVDLSGHTRGNVLPAFASRMAPVQLTTIGLAWTTGIKNMDYVLFHELLFCQGAEAIFTEKLLRLTDIFPFTPSLPIDPQKVLESRRLNVAKRKHFTFASFNRPIKITTATLNLWVEILKHTGNSRLIVGNMSETLSREFHSFFRSAGISGERLHFMTRMPVAQYYEMHKEIDLLVDTLPYSSGTTAHIGLILGVPTLNLEAPGPQTRQTFAIHEIYGVHGFSAQDASGLVKRAVELASQGPTAEIYPHYCELFHKNMSESADTSRQIAGILADFAAMGQSSLYRPQPPVTAVTALHVPSVQSPPTPEDHNTVYRDAAELPSPLVALENNLKAYQRGERTPSLLNDMGSLLVILGRTEEAIDYYQESIRQFNWQGLAPQNLIRAYLKQGQYDQAEATSNRLIAEAPTPERIVLHAKVQLRQQRSDLAGMTLYKVLDDIATWNDEVFVEYYRAALQAQAVWLPEFHQHYQERLQRIPQALQPAASAAFSRGEYSHASDLYLKQYELQPDNADAYYNHGVCLMKQGRQREALEIFLTVCSLKPEFIENWNNIGVCQASLNDNDKAVMAFQKALEIQPDHAYGLNNLGNAYHQLGDLTQSRACFDKAVALDKTYAEARWNRSLLDLSEGHLAKGFMGYEWRRFKEDFVNNNRSLQQIPFWDGIQNGQRIAVVCEQGIGDTLQFFHLAKHLRAWFEEVHGIIQGPVQRIVEATGIFDQVHIRWPESDLFSHQLHILSLPHRLHLTTDTELSVPTDLLPKELRWFPTQSKTRRLGLCWTGNPKHQNDINRTIPDTFIPDLVKRIQNHAAPVIVQKNLSNEQTEFCHAQALETPCVNAADFFDTLKVLLQLDGLITVDTALAHLAGLCGLPTYLLLPYAPDWRWGFQQEHIRWYPNTILVRQPRRLDWLGAFDRLELLLSQKTGS